MIVLTSAFCKFWQLANCLQKLNKNRLNNCENAKYDTNMIALVESKYTLVMYSQGWATAVEIVSRYV